MDIGMSIINELKNYWTINVKSYINIFFET